MNANIKYKPTNLQWLLQVPEHWDSLKMRFIGDLYSGLSGKKGSDFGIENSKYKYVPFTSIANDIYVNTDKLENVKISDNENQNAVVKEDILFLMTSETQADIGKCALVNTELKNVFLNSFCKGFRVSNEKINPRFLNYLLSSKNYRQHFIIEGKGFIRINLKQQHVYSLPIFFPCYDTQLTINNFLDNKCTQINHFIAQKQNLINLLKEQRQSIISGAFENLNSKEIKLKFCVTKIGSGVTPKGGAAIYKTDGVIFLRSQNIHNEGLKLDDVAYISNEINNAMYSSQVLKNDVLLNITGASIGRCYTYLLEDKANVNQHVCIIRPNSDILDSEFLMLQIQSGKIQNLINMIQGASREGLTNFDLKNYKIFLPEPKVQTQIVSYIKEETKIIDAAIAKTNKEIELIKEYKEALISEAVVGQLQLN